MTTIAETQAAEQTALDQLLNAVSEHEMTVLLDEGVYRHLRFKSPKNSFYWFDLITWPGHLVVGGDIQHYMFARVHDMFNFFSGKIGHINPGYWSEKLLAPRECSTYSVDEFRRQVTEHWEEYRDHHLIDADAIWRDLQEQILDDDWGELSDETMARLRLDRFESHGFRFYDTWEWDFKTVDHHFLLSCHAIVWGIAKYDAEKLKTP